MSPDTIARTTTSTFDALCAELELSPSCHLHHGLHKVLDPALVNALLQAAVDTDTTDAIAAAAGDAVVTLPLGRRVRVADERFNELLALVRRARREIGRLERDAATLLAKRDRIAHLLKKG